MKSNENENPPRLKVSNHLKKFQIFSLWDSRNIWFHWFSLSLSVSVILIELRWFSISDNISPMEMADGMKELMEFIQPFPFAKLDLRGKVKKRERGGDKINSNQNESERKKKRFFSDWITYEAKQRNNFAINARKQIEFFFWFFFRFRKIKWCFGTLNLGFD